MIVQSAPYPSPKSGPDDGTLQAILLSELPFRPDDDEFHEWIDISDLMIRVAQNRNYRELPGRDSATVIADALTRAINRGFVETERMSSVWGDRFRLSPEGENWLDDFGWAERNQEILVPASDRLVRLDHNSAAYHEVSRGLEELKDELRGANYLEVPTEERSRLLASLDSAIALWKSAELKFIQIKVGIILTIEDVTAVLKPLGKAVGAAALVDLIKQVVKDAIGIEF